MAEKTYVQEYTAVVETLTKYNEGGAKADSSIMRQGFAPEAVVFTVADDSVSGGAAQESLFDVIDSAFTPSTPTAAIVYIDIVGDVASARVDTDDLAGFRFSDFFHLLKTNGEWKIIAKTFYTHSGPETN